ncbi:MAG: hypothetical protein AAF541_24695 [Pseudomonadota bacterium]
MGLLIDGTWHDQWYDTASNDGRFVRKASQFRNWVTADGQPGPSGSGGFKAEPNRYHLYVSYACPWAHRTLIFRTLKGLENIISISVVHWFMADQGWTFAEGEGVIPDEINQATYLHQVYTQADPTYTGRVTVPILWDKVTQWIQADLFQGEDLVLPGSASFHRGLGENLTPSPAVFTARVNPGVNRAYLDGTLREDGRLHNATGASGIVVYRGNQFPERYRGDAFVPESAGNVVAQFALEEEGMNLTATQRLVEDEQWGQRDFLASTDERFRPVDAMNGPDGALYIIDMYRGIIQHDHFMTFGLFFLGATEWDSSPMFQSTSFGSRGH